MAGEEMARAIIERELHRSVVVHDDNSEDSMYDLRIGPTSAPEIAIECTAAVDPQLTETWNEGPAKGPLHLRVPGDWYVVIKHDARIKQLKMHLEMLLQDIQKLGIYQLNIDHVRCYFELELLTRIEALGIISAHCYAREGTGKVYLSLLGIGGAVDTYGTSVPQWIKLFLEDKRRSDVIFKLASSGAECCHVFIFASFGGVPWAVESYLTGELHCMPKESPNLPEPISEVWLLSTLCSKGVRWNGATWLQFEARRAERH
jgi:hypothetical protein